MSGRNQTVEKGRAIVALKRVGPHIGLNAADILLFDVLFAFTKPQDWESGQSAIVWASNAYLMDRTGFSLSALKRHARKLARAGIVSFRDSPNGKRWGRRDSAGYITEAYGFDLSPLAASVERLEALHAERQAERAQLQSIKRQITITRRKIRAKFDEVLMENIHAPCLKLLAVFDRIQGMLGRGKHTALRLKRVLTLLDLLSARLDIAPTTDREQAKLNPKEVKSDPHIQATKKKQINSNILKKHDHDDTSPISVKVLKQACPEFVGWSNALKQPLNSWPDLYRAVHSLKPMMGLQDCIWALACAELGNTRAAAAFVLVFEKHALGKIKSPNGYLRGMIRKARVGALHLSQSFYGQLSAQSKTAKV